MKKTILLLFIIVTSALFVRAQINPAWTEDEIRSANTAAGASYMTPLEQGVIMYVNLARLYPQKFARVEVEPFVGPEGFTVKKEFPEYKASLLAHLAGCSLVGALVPSEEMYRSALCWAQEMSETGRTGHNRTACPKTYGGECCLYGVNVAREVALQWLVDAGEASLGHRKICLNGEYLTAGVSHKTHPEWRYCTVLDVKWK